ncbi:hypothetical protein BpHYR1_000326 [Brachionus plicatilis]|uniref:Uncharacterized protein n=1 Tax=Brachionus plicatilis TaxID=10195 RepID=A0A3M7PHY5_BRAPC|nr:hypothetical protein BpHYR1_000326 [Brachionus plicatilis]
MSKVSQCNTSSHVLGKSLNCEPPDSNRSEKQGEKSSIIFFVNYIFVNTNFVGSDFNEKDDYSDPEFSMKQNHCKK